MIAPAWVVFVLYLAVMSTFVWYPASVYRQQQERRNG